MTKLSKILKYLAVSAFLLALVVNVKVTLTDPFVVMSEDAFAQTSTDTISGYEVYRYETGVKECCKEAMEGVGILQNVSFTKNIIDCLPGGTKPCTPSVSFSYGELIPLGTNCDIPVEPPNEECPGT